MACFQIISLNIDIFLLFSALIGLCYFGVIAWLTSGWRKIPEFAGKPGSSSCGMSVLIAARDEDHTLPGLIKDLEEQSFPPDRFEVLIIDDHSLNPVSSLSAVRNTSLQNLQVLSLPMGETGKKLALIQGARRSRFDYLLLTDADCRVHKDWIASFAAFQKQTGADLIIGLVDQTVRSGLLSLFFRLEFLSLIITGAGSAAKKHPTLCNGANLCVAKTLYLNIRKNLKLEERSGDDVFLLHAVKQVPNARIQVLKGQTSKVSTTSPETMGQFLKQRIRWASKSPSYTDRDTIALSLLVLLFNAVLVLLLGFSFFKSGYWPWLIALISGKLTVDGYMLTSGLNFFGRKRQSILLPLFELIYPFYLTLAAVTSQLFPSRWKGRSEL
ncbi:MAG: glycosyltransferase [Bacteroidales bacterium]|nr:glycosyltransferase [Bacteroidales bacterium]